MGLMSIREQDSVARVAIGGGYRTSCIWVLECWALSPISWDPWKMCLSVQGLLWMERSWPSDTEKPKPRAQEAAVRTDET